MLKEHAGLAALFLALSIALGAYCLRGPPRVPDGPRTRSNSMAQRAAAPAAGKRIYPVTPIYVETLPDEDLH